MGTVRLAEDLRLPGRQCAIKCVRAPHETDPHDRARLQERFAREASILAQLDHPALPKVSDYFETERGACIVMDYVPGRDLHAVIVDARSRGRNLDESQVVGWAEDVCAALTYLHNQSPPIVHRDVKPSNIKLTPDGQVRLVDFGLAQLVQADAGSGVTVTQGAGSRPYQPLEQFGEGRALDARVDLYALGATLYHLLAGRAPVPADERFVDPSALTPLSQLRPDVTRRTAAAVMQALAMHPSDRPSTAEDLRRALTAAPRGEARRITAVSRRNVVLVGILVALLLASVALTLWP